MYVSKALGFWCDDGPCWSWSWKSATETSMLRMLCKSSCTNFGSAGPHSKAKQHDKYGKTSPSQHIYTMGVFFLDPQFRLTKKKWWGGNYIILYRYTNNTRVALKAISVHSLAVGAQCQSSSMIFHQTAWKFLNVKHPH